MLSMVYLKEFCEGRLNTKIKIIFLFVLLVFACTNEEAIKQSAEDDIYDLFQSFEVLEDLLYNEDTGLKDDIDTFDVRDNDDLDILSDVGNEVYIQSPQFVANRDYLVLLKKIINISRENIIILHQEFLKGSTLDQIQNDLIAAKNRGVYVRVLLEKDVDDNAERVNSLRANGIDAKLDSSSRTLHLKLVLVDNKHLLLGSTNLSYSSFQYNNEVNIYLNDIEVVNKFYEYANSVISDNGRLSKIYCSSCAFTPIGDAQYADIVVPIINNAKKNVNIIMYQFSYDTDISTPNGSITKALTDAKSRGASVKLLLEFSSFDSTLNYANQNTSRYLKDKGIDVRFDSKDVVTHAKLLISDDTVVIYTGNWVYTALTGNHEVGIVVNDLNIKNMAINYFNALFNSAK